MSYRSFISKIETWKRDGDHYWKRHFQGLDIQISTAFRPNASWAVGWLDSYGLNTYWYGECATPDEAKKEAIVQALGLLEGIPKGETYAEHYRILPRLAHVRLDLGQDQ